MATLAPLPLPLLLLSPQIKTKKQRKRKSSPLLHYSITPLLQVVWQATRLPNYVTLALTTRASAHQWLR